MIDHLMGKDICTLFVEVNPGVNKYELEREIQEQFKQRIGIAIFVKPVEIGELPRSEKNPPVFSTIVIKEQSDTGRQFRATCFIF